MNREQEQFTKRSAIGTAASIFWNYNVAMRPDMFSVTKGRMRVPKFLATGFGHNKLQFAQLNELSIDQAKSATMRTYSDLTRQEQLWVGLRDRHAGGGWGQTITGGSGGPIVGVNATPIKVATSKLQSDKTISGSLFGSGVIEEQKARKLRNVLDGKIPISNGMMEKDGFTTIPTAKIPAYKSISTAAAKGGIKGTLQRAKSVLVPNKEISGTARLASVARFTGRQATRGLMFAGKAWAGYNIVKGLASAASYVMEPMGRAAVETIDSFMHELQEITHMRTGGELSASYLSHGAATERQRALEAISKAQINGRSALGSEAGYLHR